MNFKCHGWVFWEILSCWANLFLYLKGLFHHLQWYSSLWMNSLYLKTNVTKSFETSETSNSATHCARPVEMWWHKHRNQFSSFARNGRVHLNQTAGGASVQSTTGSRGVRISGSNAGYTMFRGSVKDTGYPLHSQVSPSLPLLCVTACHHISTGVYFPEGLTTVGCQTVNSCCSLEILCTVFCL